MKLLHITKQFWPARGGIENFIGQLVFELRKQNIESHILTLDEHWEKNNKLPLQETIEGIQIIRVPFFFSRRYPITRNISSLLKGYDIIHLHSCDFFLDFLAKRKGEVSCPILLTTHGFIFHTRFLEVFKKLYFKLITTKHLSQMDKVICVSEKDYSSLQQFNYKSDNVSVIQNGVLTRNDRPLKKVKKYKFLSICRLARNKRIDSALEFLNLCSKLSWYFTIAGGDYGMLSAYKEKVKKLDVDNKVDFRGFISNEEKYLLFEESVFFLSPSEYESFGISVVEAMSEGLIVIANDIQAYRELIRNGENGFLIDFQDKKMCLSLIDHLGKMDNSEVEKISRQAILDSNRFNWQSVVRKYSAEYRKLLNEKS